MFSSNGVIMNDEKLFQCVECEKKLRLENWRTVKKPDGTRGKLVDAWCVNRGCSRKHDLIALDLTPRG